MTKDEEIQSILKSNRLQIEAQNRIIARLQANQREIAAAFDCQPSDGTDLVEAAKLLKREASAAPELLAALKLFAEGAADKRPCWCDDYTHEPGAKCDNCIAWDAIDKAEGRTA